MSTNPDAPLSAGAGQQQDAASASAAAAAAAAERELTDDKVAERHRAWMAEHGRVYPDEAERERRLGIFRENLRYIEAHNRGGHSYTLGLNQFADLTDEEFRTGYCGGLLPPTAGHRRRGGHPDGDKLDDEGRMGSGRPTPPPQAPATS